MVYLAIRVLTVLAPLALFYVSYQRAIVDMEQMRQMVKEQDAG